MHPVDVFSLGVILYVPGESDDGAGGGGQNGDISAVIHSERAR